MALLDFLFGSKPKTERISTLSPQQQQFQNQIFNILGLLGGEGGGVTSSLDLLQQLLDPESQAAAGFDAVARQEFQDQIIPQIAERFAGAGALSSSGFGQALGAGAAGLESQLAQMRSQRQMGAAGSLIDVFGGLGARGLGTDEFAIQQTPGSAGFLSTVLGPALGSLATQPFKR